MSQPVSRITFEAYPKVPVTEFLPELLFEFPDMPEEALPHYLLRAINQFARNSNVLRRTSSFDAMPCVTTYVVEPQDCMAIVGIMRVIKSRTGCMGAEEVSRLTTPPAVHIGPLCGATYAWFEEPDILHIEPVRINERFSVEFSVAPTYDACEVDKSLLTDYYDVVMSGVKSHLYAMAGKPWASVQRMQECKVEFLRGIEAASMQRLAGGQRGMMKMYRPRII